MLDGEWDIARIAAKCVLWLFNSFSLSTIALGISAKPQLLTSLRSAQQHTQSKSHQSSIGVTHWNAQLSNMAPAFLSM